MKKIYICFLCTQPSQTSAQKVQNPKLIPARHSSAIRPESHWRSGKHISSSVLIEVDAGSGWKRLT